MGNTKIMDANELAAQFIRDIHWNDLPDAVQHKAKACLIDIIAAIVGGVLALVSDIAAAYAPVGGRSATTEAPIHEDIKDAAFSDRAGAMRGVAAGWQYDAG